jgi:hypothetical protein
MNPPAALAIVNEGVLYIPGSSEHIQRDLEYPPTATAMPPGIHVETALAVADPVLSQMRSIVVIEKRTAAPTAHCATIGGRP